MSFPRIWVVGGERRGDEAQALALAEEMRLPFETRRLRYNWRFWLAGRFQDATPVAVEEEVRQKSLVPPWPDLVIVYGKRAVPTARWIREQNGGRTRLVLIGHPRVPADLFDLVYTTRQYLPPAGPSVRMLPVTMSRYRQPPQATPEESSWLGALPRPHMLLMLGGETRHWKMRPRDVARKAEQLARRAEKAGGSLIVVGSARTGDDVLDEVERGLEASQCEWRVVRHDFPRFPVLLGDADELFPTADSISMISESVISGKPVGIVPAEMSWLGWLELGSERNMAGNIRRDLRRFWKFLIENGLAGTIEEPKASNTANPVFDAAKEVRQLLETSFGRLPA